MAIREDKIDSKISIDNIKDFIPNDHPCFLVENIIDCVDFSEWEDAHQDSSDNSGFHPRVLLAGVIMGFIDGIKSGRELSRRVQTDLSYIYLCGDNAPDFRTFNNFYKEFTPVIVLTIMEFNKKTGNLDSADVKNDNYEKQIREILETVYEIILNNEKEDELLGDDSGYYIPFDLDDDEEFEKYYQKVADYTKSILI